MVGNVLFLDECCDTLETSRDPIYRVLRGENVPNASWPGVESIRCPLFLIAAFAVI